MSRKLKEQIAHGAHIALHTDTGKHLTNAAIGAAIVATSTVVGAAAAPFVVFGVMSYGFWRFFKD